ncbi:MAG: DeoR/GlpR family DNA-binding transcription regulator [Clostridia bacterium]|nr:DeoR/GlpR family DNA-binding transcription regulator [Clostridia bacterium]
MFALERQQRIVELLNETGAVSVSRLSEEMGVTEETVRRDLEKLEKKELLRRTHGGALPMDDSSGEISLKKRKATNTEAKAKLAKTAVGMIATGDTIFLDASTTTFYMAREISGLKLPVTVITNSLRVINELSECESVKLIGVGGIVGQNSSFVGRFAENCIEENYFANKMFFSGKGIVWENGILESNEQECAIKKVMMKNSAEHYFMCDSSKIGRVGFIKLADFADLTGLITDAEIEPQRQAELEEVGVQIIKCV